MLLNMKDVFKNRYFVNGFLCDAISAYAGAAASCGLSMQDIIPYPTGMYFI